MEVCELLRKNLKKCEFSPKWRNNIKDNKGEMIMGKIRADILTTRNRQCGYYYMRPNTPGNLLKKFFYQTVNITASCATNFLT